MLCDLPADGYRVFSGVAPLSASGRSGAGDGFVAHTALVHADGGTPGAQAWVVTADAFHSRDDLGTLRDGEFTDLSLQGQWSNVLAANHRRGRSGDA